MKRDPNKEQTIIIEDKILQLIKVELINTLTSIQVMAIDLIHFSKIVALKDSNKDRFNNKETIKEDQDLQNKYSDVIGSKVIDLEMSQIVENLLGEDGEEEIEIIQINERSKYSKIKKYITYQCSIIIIFLKSLFKN